MAVLGKLMHAWNAFLNQAPADRFGTSSFGVSYGGNARPDRVRKHIE